MRGGKLVGDATTATRNDADADDDDGEEIVDTPRGDGKN